MRGQGAGAPAGSTLAGLAEFNGIGAEAARQALMSCCSSARWADAVLAGRPCDSVGSLLRRSDEAVDELTPDDLRDALAGHPRIGERRGDGGGSEGGGSEGGRRGGGGDWSGEEQAGMDGAAEVTRRALADDNMAYERRFGHIYLVCATGRSADELLGLLRARLAHDAGTEWQVVRSELKKINEIRLRKLIGARP
jgi:2-oxo-4-hydroxy-4-carboxy-5-ureidoimidazoline decarboxylase